MKKILNTFKSSLDEMMLIKFMIGMPMGVANKSEFLLRRLTKKIRILNFFKS